METKHISEKNLELKESKFKKLIQSEETRLLELIIFNLENEEFGTDINQVREIIRTPPITTIPNSVDFIKGITNVRGEIAVVIDLRLRFLLPVKKEGLCKHIVMTEQGKDLFGLMVDEVTQVLRIAEKDIKPPPKLVSKINKTFINGVITIDNRLIILLDLANVLLEKELIELVDFAKKHRLMIEDRQKTMAKGNGGQEEDMHAQENPDRR